jgi:signal transduction histidine kinase
MQLLRNASIRKKLVAIIMVTSGAALIVAFAALIVSDQIRFRADLSTDLETLALILAENSTAALSFSDPDAAAETLGALHSKPNILTACVYDQHGIFAVYLRPDSSASCPPQGGPPGVYDGDDALAVFEPILLDNQRIGDIYVRSDLEQISDRLYLQLTTSFVVLLGAVIVAFLMSSSLQRIISRPISSLAQTMQTVSNQEDYTVRGVKEANDELGALVESFNSMLAQIEERDAQLRAAKTELEFRVDERTEELQQQLHETRRTQEELEKVNEDLLQSNRELDDFAYIASHDLKEPLRGIYSYSAFLLEDYGDKLDAEAKARLQTLQRLSQRMETLIDTLLHYSRVGRLDLALELVDLNTVLNEVLESLRVQLTETGVEVRAPSRLPHEYCDRTRAGEVFLNLISNAIKYNDKPQKWIEIGFNTRDNEKVYYVRDNGIGIPTKHQEAIFRIFKRLHGRDKFGGGTGAGLTIVRKIIERHGGTLWVESVEGEGTTFFFTLHAIDFANRTRS